MNIPSLPVTASKNIRYIPAIDHLRAYAALLVLLYHCVFLIVPIQYENWPKAGNPFSALIYEGHTGVALFLVLSGFIFTYGSAGREIEYKSFLINRLLRIYPLMIALLFVGVSIYSLQLNPTQVLESLLPVQNLRGANPTIRMGPYNALFWTITVECQFYLIFPFLHRQLLRRGVRGLLPLLLFLILARWSSVYIGESALFASPRDIGYWTILGRLDQFLIGMITATVALRLTLASRLLRLALPLGVAGLLLALYLFNQAGGWPIDGSWKVFWPTCEAVLWALIIIGYLALLHGRDNRVLRGIAALGTISYSMYLLHLTVIDIFVSHDWVMHVPRPTLLAALFTGLACVFPATVLLSTLTYHAIEKPFLEMRRRYLAPVPDTSPALRAPAMVTEDAAPSAAPTKRWVIAGFAGMGALVVVGSIFALQSHGKGHTPAAQILHLNVEQALTVSHQIHPSTFKVLFSSDANAAEAADVGLQLLRDKELFVVAGGRWRSAFGPHHQWSALDADAVKNGLSVWYIAPRSMLLGGLVPDARHFPLRDGALILLTPPTLPLSTAGNTLEMDFKAHGHANDFALGGWGETDAGGTWSIERYAALAFRPQIIDGAVVVISVDAEPLLAPANGVTRQRLRLHFNGLTIGPEQSFSAPGTARFTIPAAVWNAEAAKLDGQVSLVFEFPDAVAPASLGPGSDDPRVLGLFFTKMHLSVPPYAP